MTGWVVALRDGAIYLPAALCAACFDGVTAVVVQISQGQVTILPVRHAASGGCLLKIRNAAGDRVAFAPDVFEANGLRHWQAEALPARWSAERAALIITLEAGDN